MITPCPHCQAEIEIDADTHAALAGHSHFACPACQGSVPVPAPIKPQLRPVLGAARPRPTPGKAAQAGGRRTTLRQSNRNFLVLGTVVLLVLGGIGGFLASKKSGDTHNTTENIRNEIINNTYFQNLITSGVTTMKNMDEITAIRSHADGYIGMSAEPLSWEQSIGLAGRTGSQILSSESATKLAVQEFLSSLSTTLPAEPASSCSGDG